LPGIDGKVAKAVNGAIVKDVGKMLTTAQEFIRVLAANFCDFGVKRNAGE
jgi:hypothetical protein